MKVLIVIGALVVAFQLLGHFAPYAPPEIASDSTKASLLSSLIFALPVIGLVMALVSFGRWRRGFHQRMRTRGFR